MYEMQPTLQDFTVDFQGCNRQFDWLGILLVCNKSDKHKAIYYSYDAECIAPMIKMIKITKSLANVSLTNKKRYDTSKNTQKFFSINNS